MAGQRSSELAATDTAERDSGGNARTSDQPTDCLPVCAGEVGGDDRWRAGRKLDVVAHDYGRMVIVMHSRQGPSGPVPLP